MSRISKILPTVLAILFLAALLLVGLVLQRNTKATYAQTGLECTNPIFLGNAVISTTEILDEVYREYRTLSYALSRAATVGEEMRGELNKYDNLVDYGQCEPNISQEKGTAVNFNTCVGADMGCDFTAGTCVMGCAALECKGDPGNVLALDKYLAQLKVIQEQDIEAVYKRANKHINELSRPITEEIKLPGEKAGDNKLTVADYAYRLLASAERQFEPSLPRQPEEMPSSCVMSETERQQVAEGKALPRYLDVCKNALSQGYYWPKSWSYTCQKECVFGASEECRRCLRGTRSCAEKSWLAEFNCRYFQGCQNETDPNKQKCAKGLNQECMDCLCQQFKDEKNYQEKCADWLCGGSIMNPVCCGTVEGTVKPDTSEARPALGAGFNHCNATISNWETQKAHASAPLIKLLNCLNNEYPVFQDNKCNWLVTSISDSHETTLMSKCTWAEYDSYGECSQEKCAETNFAECDCCYHTRGSAHYGGKKATGKGGAQCIGLSYAADVDKIKDKTKFNDAFDVCVNALNYKNKASKSDEGTHLHLNVCKVNGCDCK